MIKKCDDCLNDTRNPTITVTDGLCNVCRQFDRGFGRRYRNRTGKQELEWLRGKRAMVGVSGGKDSTAALYMSRELGMKVSAFTFDTGYYPAHVIADAGHWPAKMRIEHETIDIRQHLTPELRELYRLTAEWYENLDPFYDPAEVTILYSCNRSHYAANNLTPMPYLRGCQLCRKLVIPAYYAEAVRCNADVVVLGMNEWTHLSGNGEISGLRRLQPGGGKPVYIAHLPFILGWRLENTQMALEAIGWQAPSKEDLVETNGNSCCLARATQFPFQRLLGFHPDTTRLSREITCGFLPRELAEPKLMEARRYNRTVRQVLEEADII